MRKKDKLAMILMVIILIIVSLFGCVPSKRRTAELINSGTLDVKEAKVKYFANLYSLPVAVVGYADYVFVGKVLDIEGTKYEDDFPYTSYTITALENIKGELKLNERMFLIKEGGIMKNRLFIQVLEGDVLPKTDRTYVFLVKVNEKNELYSGSVNSNLEIKNAEEYKSSQVYLNVLEAKANEEVVEKDETGKRYISKHDVNFKDSNAA